MDRAHRLGQTKQVTVYRLIVKGTIEEKILQRAREKSEIQKMVISGGDFKPEALKAKEMVSLLLDDDEMETRCKLCFALHIQRCIFFVLAIMITLSQCSFSQTS